MSKHSITLIIIGVILISVAFFSASNIPLEANKDFIFGTNKHAQQGHLQLTTRERQDMYIEAHVQRRLLQNFYIGTSGLICLFAGLIVSSKKSS